MKKKCLQCNKEIKSQRTKFCSNECYRINTRVRYHRYNPFKGKTSTTTGAISELRVAVDLLVKGYDVFRALSPSSPCDLAILKDYKLLRIEVRTAHKTASGSVYHRKPLPEDDKDNIDHYAWVLPKEIIYDPELPLHPITEKEVLDRLKTANSSH